MREAILALLLILLAACASKPERKSHESPAPSHRQTSSRQQNIDLLDRANQDIGISDPCAPIYQHDERNYTAGGLYAPELSDSAPASAIDISKLVEPIPKSEPLARYGNKSPYTVLGKTYQVLDKSKPYEQRGIASWYGQKFNGRKTSSGEIYSICDFSAAHKTLPLPSYVRVTNTRNGQSVVVRVNDRGPFHQGRIIDLSYVAAIRIGLDKTGTAPVLVEVLNADNAFGSKHIDRLRRDSDNDNERANERDNGDDELSLQFGSFSDRDNAMRLQDRLQEADIGNIKLDRAQAQGQTVWRVQLHDLKNEQLEAIFEKIRQLGLAKPKVIAQKL
ncbi:MAG: septal ring lytic transglycosylase RlpA family protein [Arenimonas sp.]